MIIRDLHVIRVVFFNRPGETDAVLIVDADTALPFSILFQHFKAVAGKRCNIAQVPGVMDDPELAVGGTLDGRGKFHGSKSIEALFFFRAGEALDHTYIISRRA